MVKIKLMKWIFNYLTILQRQFHILLIEDEKLNKNRNLLLINLIKLHKIEINFYNYIILSLL